MIYLLTGRRRLHLPAPRHAERAFHLENSRIGRSSRLPRLVYERAVQALRELPGSNDWGRDFFVRRPRSWIYVRELGRSLDLLANPGSQARVRWPGDAKAAMHEASHGLRLSPQTLQSARRVAIALIDIANKGLVAFTSCEHCEFCWRPTETGSRFCTCHAPGTPKYFRRHHANAREKEVTADYIQLVRRTRKMLAHEYNMIDQWVEQVVLIDGTTKTQRNHEINPDFLALLPKYWPRIAAYIDFDTSDLIGDVLYKLGFGGDASFSGAKEKEKACIDFMQRSSTPFLWSNLDRVEALLMVWEDTSSRRRIRGNRVPEELLGLQADSATIAKLAKQGLTQRQIAYQLGVSAATVNRRLRRAPVP